MDDLRQACAEVATRARYVGVQRARIDAYAAELAALRAPAEADVAALAAETLEWRAAFWLTLDAVNFGSGWFPTLHKRAGRSGYSTIAAGIRERFQSSGPWSAEALSGISAAELARALGQDPAHELMALFARSLRDLGAHVTTAHDGSFAGLACSAGGSAVALADRLGRLRCFADESVYDGIRVPFLKRAQIAAADLDRAGVIEAADINKLTMFADNLVPHVLRLDGILRYQDSLVRKIERQELIAHGSPEEVEIRACALHAVELIAAARPGRCAAELDQLLWLRGGQPRYKAVPRHRSRCTAY
jgi:hypothetical protein